MISDEFYQNELFYIDFLLFYNSKKYNNKNNIIYIYIDRPKINGSTKGKPHL